MQHAKNLLLSRPYYSRIPDQTLLVSEAGSGSNHVQATRDGAGSYAMIYVPAGGRVTVDLQKLSGEALLAYWFDPRTGVARQFDSLVRSGTREFTPPGGGPDWVLVLDDASRHYAAPGQEKWPSRE
jgi:hypothetical protein